MVRRNLKRSVVIPWALFGMVVLGVLAWILGSLPGSHPDRETRRWHKLDQVQTAGSFSADWSAPNASVYSVPALRQPRPRPTLRDLADNGQAHAIDYLAKVPHSWADLQQALTDASEPASGTQDPFRFDRVLVATVTKGTDWNPGDRMVWTNVFIKPINFAFAGYTVAATETETVKLTNVEDTHTRKLSAEIGLTIPTLEGPKASLSPTAEHTVKTTSDITAQYEKLGIDIMPNFLRIIREAETGGDVLGNTTVSLSIVTDPATILKKTPDEADKSVPGNDLVLLVTGAHLEEALNDLDAEHASLTALPQAPLPHCALRAKVSMQYEQRHVLAGAEFYDESRQSVSLLRIAREPKEVEIVRADDVSPAVWSIHILPNLAQNAGPEPQQDFLRAHIGGGPWRELVFTDYGLATRLTHWIRTHPGAEVQHLTFNYPAGASVVPFKKTDDECASPDKREKARGVYRAAQTVSPAGSR